MLVLLAHNGAVIIWPAVLFTMSDVGLSVLNVVIFIFLKEDYIIIKWYYTNVITTGIVTVPPNSLPWAIIFKVAELPGKSVDNAYLLGYNLNELKVTILDKAAALSPIAEVAAAVPAAEFVRLVPVTSISKYLES